MDPVELYDPKQMTQALLESFPARRFLSATFFGEETHDTKSFQIDLYKGSRRLSPIVHPKMAGKVVDREKYRTLEFTPPYLKPMKVTEADNILTRQPGEVVYTAPGANTPATRAAALLGSDMAELDEMNLRRVEAMAAEALFYGRVTVKGDGVDTVVDYDFDAAHTPTLSGADLWNTSTGDPIKNLRAWKRQISKDAGITATDLILGTDAAEAFLNNEKLLKLLDNRNLMMGLINPADMGEGVTYLGRLTAVGLDVWTYDEWYYDEDTDTEKPMVPVDHALIIARSIRATVHYGVIQDIEAGQYASRAFAKSWVEKNPSARFLLVQSAPLPVVHQVNGLVSAIVV